jgi:hypothetical protein
LCPCTAIFKVIVEAQRCRKKGSTMPLGLFMTDGNPHGPATFLSALLGGYGEEGEQLLLDPGAFAFGATCFLLVVLAHAHEK